MFTKEWIIEKLKKAETSRDVYLLHLLWTRIETSDATFDANVPEHLKGNW